jgi:hypothetical protein
VDGDKIDGKSVMESENVVTFFLVSHLVTYWTLADIQVETLSNSPVNLAHVTQRSPVNSSWGGVYSPPARVIP